MYRQALGPTQVEPEPISPFESLPRADRTSEREAQERVSLFDILIVLARGKWVWLCCGALFGIIAFVVSHLLPVEYRARTEILPPQQSVSSASILMGQVGNLLGMGVNTGLGLKDPNDLILAILQSRTVADALIQQFDLQKVYKRPDIVLAEIALAKHSKIETTLNGTISVSVDDRDPKRAAAIANGYIQQLYAQNERLAITEAAQRRLFFEKQMEHEKNALADAEVALKQTQMKTGVLELQGQTELALRNVADLRAGIASDEVEVQSLLQSETPDNPDVIRIQGQIKALREQLALVENNKSDPTGAGNTALPTGTVPELALDYVRKLREVRYHETLFGLLARQYQAAKIDESKEAPAIQIIDAAVPPHFKYWPPRGLITVASMATGIFLACVYLILAEVFRRTLREEEYAGKWMVLKRAIWS